MWPNQLLKAIFKETSKLRMRWNGGLPISPLGLFMIVLYFTLSYFSNFSDPHNLFPKKKRIFFRNFPEKFPTRSSLAIRHGTAAGQGARSKQYRRLTKIQFWGSRANRYGVLRRGGGEEGKRQGREGVGGEGNNREVSQRNARPRRRQRGGARRSSLVGKPSRKRRDQRLSPPPSHGSKRTSTRRRADAQSQQSTHLTISPCRQP